MTHPALGKSASPQGATLTRAYLRVIAVWLAVLAALWWLQRAFV
jgi:hypothetical protein